MKQQSLPPIPNLMTVPEVASRCHVSIRTVRRWIAEERIAVLRLGRKVLIAEADLAAFLEACRRQGPGGDR